MYGVGFDVLDLHGLAGGLVDRVHHDAVFAALENFLAVDIDRVLGAIRSIQITAVRMHVDRACRLTRPDVLRLGERFRAEHDLRIDLAAVHLVGVHLVLRFDRHVHPRLGRMEIQVPRPELFPTVGRDRHFVRQHAVLVVEDFQRARVFRLGGGAFVAAGHQNRQPVVGRHAHLMREDAGVDGSRLLHLFPGRKVLIDAVDAQRARIVERNQDKFRRDVGADVDGARRQRYRFAMRRQRAARRIDVKRGDVMLGPGFAVTGRAAAGRNVKISSRHMRPGILHARRQRDGGTLDQRGSGDIDVVVREIGTHVGIERDFPGDSLCPRHVRRGGCARNQRHECTTIDHDGISPINLPLNSLRS